MSTKNIMIVGVGGQGTLLASRILGNAVIGQGYDVKVSEVHGMSQRGGSVVTYVKFGNAVHSPIIDKGEADIILAFECLEAYRALPWLKKGGTMIVNNQQINRDLCSSALVNSLIKTSKTVFLSSIIFKSVNKDGLGIEAPINALNVANTSALICILFIKTTSQEFNAANRYRNNS